VRGWPGPCPRSRWRGWPACAPHTPAAGRSSWRPGHGDVSPTPPPGGGGSLSQGSFGSKLQEWVFAPPSDAPFGSPPCGRALSFAPFSPDTCSRCFGSYFAFETRSSDHPLMCLRLSLCRLHPCLSTDGHLHLPPCPPSLSPRGCSLYSDGSSKRRPGVRAHHLFVPPICTPLPTGGGCECPKARPWSGTSHRSSRTAAYDDRGRGGVRMMEPWARHLTSPGTHNAHWTDSCHRPRHVGVQHPVGEMKIHSVRSECPRRRLGPGETKKSRGRTGLTPTSCR